MALNTKFLMPFVALVSLPVSFLPARAYAQAGTWTSKTPMPTARAYSVSGVINGKIYVVTGDGPNAIGTNEVYDPVSDSWATKTPDPTPSPGAAGGVINGKLFVVGGCGPASDCRVDTLNTLEIYDPATGTWATGAPAPTARSSAVAGVINGKLYVAGGQTACPPCVQVPTLEVYDPVSNSWTTKSPMLLAVGNGPASAVINGQLFVFGGLTNSLTPTGMVQAYDPASDTWTAKALMPTPRFNIAAAGLINGIAYVVGGDNSSSSIVGTNEAYNPATDAWTTAAPMITARVLATGGVVNGALYVVGGFGKSPGGVAMVAINEAFTPAPTCPTSLAPASESFGPAGGLGSFTINAAPTCSWTLTFSDRWITPFSPALSPGGGPLRGTGNRVITYEVAANTGGPRNGTISVNGLAHIVTQLAFSCTATISPSFASPGVGGGTFFVSVTAPGATEGAPACPWKAVSNVPWVTVRSGASGSGGGVVVLDVAPNSGGARSGTATIAGNTFTVNQGFGDCGAVDVTSKVIATPGPYTPDPADLRQLQGRIGVIDISLKVVESPISLVLLGLPNGVSVLANDAGTGVSTTNCYSPQGDFVLNVYVPGGNSGFTPINVTFLVDVPTIGLYPGYTIKVLEPNGFAGQ